MYQALHATSLTLQQFLTGQILSDTFLAGAAAPFTVRGMSVSLQTPREMLDAGREGVSLWLYRVMRDDLRLNDPPRRTSPTTVAHRPLPVRLHYLVTPITTRANLGDPIPNSTCSAKCFRASIQLRCSGVRISRASSRAPTRN